MKKLTDSVIDFPRDTLCPEIWEKVIDKNGVKEVWQLKPEVRTKIQQLIDILISQTKLEISDVHITGSITSNSYTNNADIDVHLLNNSYVSSPEQDQNLNTILRDTYKSIGKVFIDKHPIEVYFQPNKFQDLMSIGCYDFLKSKWLVGPELTDPSFNPYSEYYKEIQSSSEELLQKIRNTVFSIYEISIVCLKNYKTEMYTSLREIFLDKLSTIQDLYSEIRAKRKVYSSPQSEEEALTFRNSRKWKVADATFKLLDKFGYTAILRQFVEDYNLLQQSNDIDVEVIENMLKTVKKYIYDADKLSEKEMFESEQLDEGVKETISSFALALALLIPGVASAKTLDSAKQTFKIPSSEVQQKQNEFQALLKDINPDKNMNGFKAWQALNILSLTLYGEGRSEIKNGGIYPIIDTIINRTGTTQDIDRVANICVGRKAGCAFQYSFWNKNKDALKMIKSGETVFPIAITTNVIERQAWKDCIAFSVKVISGKYKVKDTEINSYYVTNMKDPPNWRKQLVNKKIVGRHTFGYVKSNDPKYMDMATMTSHKSKEAFENRPDFHIIKRGDTLSGLSDKFGMTIKSICKLNNISSKAVLKLGQKIKLR